jgi:uncharacterized protein (DUF2126 family)
VTPYSESQWRAIDNLGRRVDADLIKLDVRLTQGGEPTFVAVNGGDAPEWNFTADGPGKRALAGKLLRRLRERFAPGGLLYFGQGKWYPGEALPRWALGLYWRKDGASLWNDLRLIANEDTGANHDAKDARRLIVSLAKKLGIAPDRVLPAYEDPWPALAAEGRLSRSLARLLKRGIGPVAGYALPLAPAVRKARGPVWKSSRWPLKLGRLYLVGGDSPAGYRLPLDTLPAAGNIVRTALCVEARGGRLRVFIPPLNELEDYLSLVSAIEQCASELELPVIPEGYEPPPGSPLSVLKVTPDPGVIEVNVHPAAGWNELVTITTIVYEEARALGLVAEKFMRDGRRNGTGGGSHITLGGTTFAESPLLRRPEVLASLIAYWQNHPALSYLFSGQYIGPTSQAPRVDEARHDSLYELEIAFQQLSGLRDAGAVAPEQIDRLLRNLLVDVTGNTHRAEFCVDKLASPDGPAGRLGLLELRAFEMAPHERMAAVQFLLVRALVARFWKTPFQDRSVQWGTVLHDRFMLPHYLAEDMRTIVSELKAAGYAFEFDWLAPFFEFRFPLCGTVSCGVVALELRHALEPWPVLGEAATSLGTSRAVDASMDRLQVRLSGMDASRHILLCNGRRVPLQPAASAGEFVAGIRYRARTFPSMLHPTIGLHAPLLFDIVDAHEKRLLGGCAYHVMDPGGKFYDRLPADSTDAEARRAARFVPRSGTTATVNVPPEASATETPCTLDLRFQPE